MNAKMRSRHWAVRMAVVVAVLMGLVGGAIFVVQAQTPVCRDVNNLTICADTFDEFPAAANGGGFRLRGNVRIGPKGGAALVKVEDIGNVFDGSILNEDISTATYFHFNQPDPNTGTTDFLIGDVRMINDPTGLTLMGTSPVDDPTTSDGSVLLGRLFVDTVNRKIFNPPAGAVPIFVQRGVKRNANIRLAFLSRVGALAFYKQGGSVDELSAVDGVFDLNPNVKKFKGTLPIKLKLGESAENPNLQITMRADFDDKGQFNGAVDGFKFRLGGLLMNVTGATVKPPTATTPAEFTAALVKVLKTDNAGVPNLDPVDATLVFQFTNLKYANGQWSIGGVEVPINEWVFGSAFKMTSQTLGLVSEAGVQSLQIKSTMQFGSGSGASKLPIVLKIGRADAGGGQFKPVFQAGLTNFSPKLGVMTFKLQNALFVGDAAQNFFGIKATNVDLQWPPYLGGKTALGVGDFQLGINANKKLKFKLGNGTVGLPTLENNVFIANLQATIGVVQETVTMTGTGTFALKLPGNQNSAGIVGQAILRYSRDVTPTPQLQVMASSLTALPCRNPLGSVTSCPGAPPPPPTGPKAFEMKLAGFDVKIAGFKFTVVNPRGLDDGGFAVDSAALTLPTGISLQNAPSGGILVQGLSVKGNGDVAIQGGGFELPTIKVGSLQLVALRGSFTKTATGDYEFRAGGKLPMPGAEPGSANSGVSLNVVIRTTATGTFSGMGVNVEVFSPPLPPIPLGSTGFALTRVQGSFDINNGTSTISLGVTASSQFAIPLGALGTLPIAKTDGNITAQFNPFKFTGNVSLTVLIFNVANAAIGIGDGQGFGGGPGMNASVNVNAVVIKGNFNVRVGKGTPSDPNKRRFAASAGWEIGINKNQFGPGLPPIDLIGSTVNFAGGIFTDKNVNPSKETIGIKGTRCGVVLCIGVFINLKEQVGSGNFFDFTNLDKYVLIPATAVRAAAANGEQGFASRALSVAEAQQLGVVLAADQIDGATQIMQDTIPVMLDKTTTLVAGINHTGGNPVVTLRLPNNTVLTEAAVDNVTTTFIRESSEFSGTNLLFVIKGAAPGQYQILVDNAPAQYEKVSYTLNEQPVVTITAVTCAGGNLAGLTVTCSNGVEASDVADADAPDALDATGATVKWSSSDIDSPDATISVGYVPDTGSANNVDFTAITTLVEDKPLGNGSYTADLRHAGSGAYRMVVIIDDNQNAAVYAVSNRVVTVNDKRAPAVPTGLTAVSQAGELLVKWTQNSDGDLGGYEIGFGLVNDPNQFVYTRNMGPKEVITGTNNIVDAKIWGLADNTTVFYGLRAYDRSGNYSAWTPLQSAQPWALSPNTWTPTPNGNGAGVIEIGFAAPLKVTTLGTSLTVKDANGAPVAGTTYLLVDFDSNKAYGVGFEPGAPLNGAFTATLAGGAAGVQAEDGRTMGGNYTWSFTLKAPEVSVYLPLITQ